MALLPLLYFLLSFSLLSPALSVGGKPYCGIHCNLPFFKENSFNIQPELSDDFDGLFNRVPSIQKWHVRNPLVGQDRYRWYGRQPSLFTSDGVYQSFGKLRIEASAHPNEEDAKRIFNVRPRGQGPSFSELGYYGFTSGMVESKTPVLYGYIESRLKPIKDKIVSAFWLNAITKDYWSEIDVLESAYVTEEEQRNGADMRKLVVPNAHVFRNKSAGIKEDNKFSPDVDIFAMNDSLADNYHVFAVDWSPETITWYVDGFPFAQTENIYWHQPLFVKFDIETNERWQGVIPDIEKMGTKTFSIDYVRVYKYEKKPVGGVDSSGVSNPPMVGTEAPSTPSVWDSTFAPKLQPRWVNSPLRKRTKHHCSHPAGNDKSTPPQGI